MNIAHAVHTATIRVPVYGAPDPARPFRPAPQVGTKPMQIRVYVDLNAIAMVLGAKAANNKHKRARYMKGAVVIEALDQVMP